MGEFVALVLKHPKSTRENVVISYRELLYTCKEILSDFVFFGCLIDEIVNQNDYGYV